MNPPKEWELEQGTRDACGQEELALSSWFAVVLLTGFRFCPEQDDACLLPERLVSAEFCARIAI